MVDKSTIELLEKRNQASRLKRELQAELSEGLTAGDLIAECNQDASQKLVPSSTKQMVSILNQELDSGFQLGFFDSLTPASRDAWPSLLCRLPIFMPISRKLQKKYLNSDNALAFSTPFGRGERYGPNLDTFDEDVLLAISRLRMKRLRGDHDKLPVRVSKHYRGDDKGKIEVEAVICTVTEIIDELGYQSDGGRTYKEIKKSVIRLANTSLMFYLNAHERYLGKWKAGQNFKIFDLKSAEFGDDDDNESSENDTVFMIQFSPLVSQWLKDSFSYLDHEVRKNLGRKSVAKGLHKFLSSQPKAYSRRVDETATTIGLFVPLKEQRRQLEEACKDLVQVGFLESYEITGTGRKTPLTLITTRA